MEKRPERTICLEELRRRIARLESGPATRRHVRRSPAAATALDGILPERGFRRGTLVEWLSAGEGTGACTLALLAAREACRDGGMLAVLDRRREFCPPAAVRLGIEPEQLLVVHAESAADHDWAMDQVLRSPAVAAVLAWPETTRRPDLPPLATGRRRGRRPGAVAPAGGGTRRSLLGRRAAAGRAAMPICCIAKPQAAVDGLSVLRCRGGTAGRSVDVELDDETYRVHPLGSKRRQLQIATVQIDGLRVMPICNLLQLQVVERCRRFSPIVGLEPTDRESILLDITGLAHLFGGEAALAEAIVRDFARLGLAVRVAVADTIGAAWAAAHYGRRNGGRKNGRSADRQINGIQFAFAIFQFSPSTLPPSPFLIIPPGETPLSSPPCPSRPCGCRRKPCGCWTSWALPGSASWRRCRGEEFLSRFGPVLLAAPGPGLRAVGRAGAGLPAAADVRGRLVGRVSDRPAGNDRSGVGASDRPGGGDAGPLRPRRLAAGMPADCSKSTIRNPAIQQSLRLSVGLFQPTAAAEHLFELVQLQLERLRIPSPVTAIRVAATLTAPLEPRRQAMLFDFGGDTAPMPCGTRRVRTFGRAGGAAQQPAGTPGGGGRAAAARGPTGTLLALRSAGGRRRRRSRACRAEQQGAAGRQLPPRPLRLLPRPLLLACCASDCRSQACTAQGPPLRFQLAGQEHHDRAELGGRSGSKPAGGAAGRWAATISASNRRRPPLLALPPAARWKMVFARNVRVDIHPAQVPGLNAIPLK